MTDLQKFLKEATSEIVALGKRRGFNFTEADVTSLADGQLSEEQLDGVSAGVDLNPSCVPVKPVLIG